MKILKRFNENQDNVMDLSPDRLNDIIKELTQFSSELKSKLELVDSLLNELENYTSGTDERDQIDESILNLQLVRKNLNESLDKTDNTLNQLEDYGDQGRQYLFGE